MNKKEKRQEAPPTAGCLVRVSLAQRGHGKGWRSAAQYSYFGEAKPPHFFRCWFLVMGEWTVSCGCWRVISDLGSSGVTCTLAGQDMTVDLMVLSAGYTFFNL